MEALRSQTKTDSDMVTSAKIVNPIFSKDSSPSQAVKISECGVSQLEMNQLLKMGKQESIDSSNMQRSYTLYAGSEEASIFAKMKQVSLDSAGEGFGVGDISPKLEPVTADFAKI